jgi:DNA-binding transcriptional regulator YiaG
MILLDDHVRVRVIRALLGMSSKKFAETVGVCAGTVCDWEHGRATPQAGVRPRISKLCQEHGIAALPSGMPVPASDVLLFKEAKSG